MLELYREERGRGVHENGIPLEAIQILCEARGIEGEDRLDVERHFRALDLTWLEWREKRREAERRKAAEAAKTPPPRTRRR